jgi:hypothetical protein
MKITKSYLREVIKEELDKLQPGEDGVVSAPQVKKNVKFESFYKDFEKSLLLYKDNAGFAEMLAFANVRAAKPPFIDSLFDPKENPQEAKRNAQLLGARIDPKFKELGINRTMSFNQGTNPIRKHLPQTSQANTFTSRLERYYTQSNWRPLLEILTAYFKRNPDKKISNDEVFKILGGKELA